MASAGRQIHRIQQVSVISIWVTLLPLGAADSFVSPIDCGVSRDRVYRRQRLRGRRGGAVNNFVRFSGAVGGGLIGCEVSGDLLLFSVPEADIPKPA